MPQSNLLADALRMTLPSEETPIKSEPLTVSLIEVPSCPLGLPYSLITARKGGTVPFPEEVELIVQAVMNGETLSYTDEQRERIGRRSPKDFVAHVTRTVQGAFTSGDPCLYGINLTVLIKGLPVWLAHSLGIPFLRDRRDREPDSFFSNGAFQLPPGLNEVTVSGQVLSVTAERIYTDFMRTAETTYRMLKEAGVRECDLNGIVPQALTGDSLWTVSLGALAHISGEMPSYLYEPLREELKALHPVYESLVLP